MRLFPVTPVTPLTAAFFAIAACGSDDLEPIRSPATTSDAGSASVGNPTTNGAGNAEDAGDAGEVVTALSCKRGIAANATPGSAFSPTATTAGVSWWYDWSNSAAAGIGAGIEFVPMIWGTSTTSGPIPAGSHHLLGFNEPNFKAQSNLTPSAAASQWPAVEALAKAQGIPIVSPAVNFCGSPTNSSGCSDPSVTSPYAWLQQFFSDCSGCQVDAIAVHWYNCDLPSLQGYIDGNASLAGFVQFGKPIWVTELACDGSHSVADQKAYMQAAIPYLEGNAHVARYAWFSADPIPNARLANADGSLTDLGQTYVALPQTCAH